MIRFAIFFISFLPLSAGGHVQASRCEITAYLLNGEVVVVKDHALAYLRKTTKGYDVKVMTGELFHAYRIEKKNCEDKKEF